MEAYSHKQEINNINKRHKIKCGSAAQCVHSRVTPTKTHYQQYELQLLNKT